MIIPPPAQVLKEQFPSFFPTPSKNKDGDEWIEKTAWLATKWETVLYTGSSRLLYIPSAFTSDNMLWCQFSKSWKFDPAKVIVSTLFFLWRQHMIHCASYWCVRNRWHKELCDKSTLQKEGKSVGRSAGPSQCNVLCWAFRDGNKSSCLMVTHFTVLWFNVWQRTLPGWQESGTSAVAYSSGPPVLHCLIVGCSPAGILKKKYNFAVTLLN